MDFNFSLGPNLTAEEIEPRRIEDVVILGTGPAGLAAAIYAARANHSPLVVTGSEPGGQVATTTTVENYPGFVDGILGPDLSRVMQEQAERFGARIELDTITSVDISERPFHLVGESGEYRARSLIIATGASPYKLGVPGERELTGRGVSYCATCDGYFFKDKEIVVIGGGDSALEEGIFLTKFCSRVNVIHRRDTLRAGAILQKRAFENDKVKFIWNSVVTGIAGDGKVEAVRLRDVITGEERLLPASGVFIYIGHRPNTDLFAGQLEMDEHGYLVTDKWMHTNVEGVFAAGEAADPRFRQVITSAGMGAAAAIEAEKFLAEHAEELVPA